MDAWVHNINIFSGHLNTSTFLASGYLDITNGLNIQVHTYLDKQVVIKLSLIIFLWSFCRRSQYKQFCHYTSPNNISFDKRWKKYFRRTRIKDSLMVSGRNAKVITNYLGLFLKFFREHSWEMFSGILENSYDFGILQVKIHTIARSLKMSQLSWPRRELI